eukprot:CAMPEP_0172825882 /NCGR_PEP_ID=MMETSP1075-20121228/19019_1 /TAXON_ID=2916 /ORGANISM="Ceratium fusus, Strain PA161109" /LENGTH=162 /DNA_ID=CAMNT_0013667417 /DNA_START=417 /DNA_END=901 /DNA_ORIENTATION=+
MMVTLASRGTELITVLTNTFSCGTEFNDRNGSQDTEQPEERQVAAASGDVRDQGRHDNHEVQPVPCIPQVGSFVHEETPGDDLKHKLHGKKRGEDWVQNVVDKIIEARFIALPVLIACECQGVQQYEEQNKVVKPPPLHKREQMRAETAVDWEKVERLSTEA